MRRSIVVLVVVAVAAIGAYTVLAGGKSCGERSAASVNGSCDGSTSATTVVQNSHGKIAGRFDPAMSGACRFACATKLSYKARDVMAQPGATAGKLTQCPVSGVVFAVDAGRPRVRLA